MPRKGRSLNSTLLALAWLLVLGSLAGAVAYVILTPRPETSPQVSEAGEIPLAEEMATPEAIAPADDREEAGKPADEPIEAEEEADDGATIEEAETKALPEAAPSEETSEQSEADIHKKEPRQSASQVSPHAAAPPTNAASDDPPWRRFSIPFDRGDQRPRIALVISGLGLSKEATSRVIRNFPPQVTLSFLPYAKDVSRWVSQARASGHEVMLDLPMEPITFPADDPGPWALITSLPKDENLRRLDEILAVGSGYVGLAGYMGSRFSTSNEKLTPIFTTLKARGLLYLDNRPTDRNIAGRLARQVGLPFAFNDRMLDERQASGIQIDARLSQIERIALTEGFAVAMARPFPTTIKSLEAWVASLESKGFALAPITAMVGRQRVN